MPKSVFQDIYEDIKRGIVNGAFAYQSLLYSENEFCKQYGCSRSTIRRALAELTKDGYVQPIQGKGVRVIWRPDVASEAGYSYSMGGLESFDTIANNNGFKAETKVRAFERRTVDEELSKISGFDLGTEIYFISRVRYANGIPIQIDRSYLLAAEAPELTAKDCTGSLYGYLESKGVGIATGKRVITLDVATQDDMSVMDVEAMPVVGVLRGQHFDTNGTMFEFSEIRQHPHYFMVKEVTTRASHPSAQRQS